MSRELRLTVTFEGQGSGLENRRLAIDDFAPALVSLQRAYRRIAQAIIRNATEETDNNAVTGRFSRFVGALSFEIDTISHQSPVQVALACPIPFVAIGDTMSMFAEATMDRAADELIEALELESRGRLRSSAVRKYLRRVPSAVTRHTYQVQKLNGETRGTELGFISHTELEKDYPGFMERRATLVGVHFPPGVAEIRLWPASGQSFTASASPELVDEALKYREVDLTALVIKKGRRFTTLWLSPADVDRDPPSREMRTAYLEARWRDVIKALAE